MIAPNILAIHLRSPCTKDTPWREMARERRVIARFSFGMPSALH